MRSLVHYLGYTGHIASQPASGIVPRADRAPSYPPSVSTTPSRAELETSRTWWEEDNIVSHILTSRLTTSVLTILPFEDDDDSLTPRTARTVYEILRKLYSVHNHTSSSALYSELCNLQCGGRVLEYVTKWRAGISQLRAARFVISFPMVIERFLDRLPTSVPYDILHFHTMKTINDVPFDDMSTFIKLTDEVLEIDNTYRRTSSNRPTPARPSTNAVHHAPPTQSSSSTLNTVIKTSFQPRSSLVCSNCGIIGHTVDKCFKAGGGLEGKRDQYLASRTRIQAHLAHITEILDADSMEEVYPSHIPLDSCEPDIIVEPEITPPPIAALSITPTVVSPSIVVDTEVDNEDFFYAYYIQGEHKSRPIAFTTLPRCSPTPDLGYHSASSPIAFAASSFPFNSILDSGCTNHIFRDRNVFWTYDTTLATPVKTANCGFLNTLARGSVRFRLKSGNHSAIFVLKDCLHAPDAPLNLLSVGAMTEKGATFMFAPGATSIVFPHP